MADNKKKKKKSNPVIQKTKEFIDLLQRLRITKKKKSGWTYGSHKIPRNLMPRLLKNADLLKRGPKDPDERKQWLETNK